MQTQKKQCSTLEQTLCTVKKDLEKGEVSKQTIEHLIDAAKRHLRSSARFKSLRKAFGDLGELDDNAKLELSPAQLDGVRITLDELDFRLWAMKNDHAKQEFPVLLKWWRKVKPEYQKYAITVIRKQKGRKEADQLQKGTLLQKTEFLRLAKKELKKLQAEIEHQEKRWQALSDAEQMKIKFAIKKQTNTDPKKWWRSITVLERITVLRKMMDELLGSERDQKSESR